MIGIDEVGRGCWAGPLLVVAARGGKELPPGLKDSKKLSKKRRELLYTEIAASCEIGEGWVTAQEIDELGLNGAMKLGVSRALEQLGVHPQEQIIMDGTINYCSADYTNVVCEPRADDSYPIVSAASIYAKVSRDHFMSQLGEAYSVYEFHKHVGYGTKLHSELLKLHGISDLHRRSFGPVKLLETPGQP